MVEIIRTRTRNGSFRAKGSSGSRARRYDPRYARQVHKSPSGPVDLELSGKLMKSLHYKIEMSDGDVTAYTYYRTGHGRRLFEIHQLIGTGKRRIKRVFDYLNVKESESCGAAGRKVVRNWIRSQGAT